MYTNGVDIAVQSNAPADEAELNGIRRINSGRDFLHSVLQLREHHTNGINHALIRDVECASVGETQLRECHWEIFGDQLDHCLAHLIRSGRIQRLIIKANDRTLHITAKPGFAFS